MIVASNAAGATKTFVSAGARRIDADTPSPAGKGNGARSHQLLEAPLARRAATTLRTIADERALALESADVTVEVDRSHGEETILRTSIDLRGAPSRAERNLLLKPVRLRPARKTRSKRIFFVRVGASR